MSIKTILEPILAKLSHMGKHQRSFLMELFSLLLARQGKALRGLEISALACINVSTKKCFALEASRT